MFLKKLILIFFISLQILDLHCNTGFANAQMDDVPEDDDDDDVDIEGPPIDDAAVVGKEHVVTGQDESDDKPLKPSPDADSTFLFTKPSGQGNELPAGKDVHFLVGFANRGSKDFVVESMDASFRYPLDFSFHIQNFSVITYNKVVKPKQEISLYYAFYTSDTFTARPFGLTVNLFYKDTEGNQYLDAVFNETVTIVEVDESLDGETFFLYVFLAACAVLLVVAAHQFLLPITKRKIMSSTKTKTKTKIEMGTQNNHNDVDYDWLPKEMLNELNKSPRRSTRLSPNRPKQGQVSPKQSPPRQRRAKRGAGGKEE